MQTRRLRPVRAQARQLRRRPRRPPSRPRSKYSHGVDTIRANGVDFAYLSEGSGPLVLLLHGFPDTARTWDRVMPEVARAGFRVVAPFMRGYHPTEIPKP